MFVAVLTGAHITKGLDLRCKGLYEDSQSQRLEGTRCDQQLASTHEAVPDEEIEEVFKLFDQAGRIRRRFIGLGFRLWLTEAGPKRALCATQRKPVSMLLWVCVLLLLFMRLLVAKAMFLS